MPCIHLHGMRLSSLYKLDCPPFLSSYFLHGWTFTSMVMNWKRNISCQGKQNKDGRLLILYSALQEEGSEELCSGPGLVEIGKPLVVDWTYDMHDTIWVKAPCCSFPNLQRFHYIILIIRMFVADSVTPWKWKNEPHLSHLSGDPGSRLKFLTLLSLLGDTAVTESSRPPFQGIPLQTASLHNAGQNSWLSALGRARTITLVKVPMNLVWTTPGLGMGLSTDNQCRNLHLPAFGCSRICSRFQRVIAWLYFSYFRGWLFVLQTFLVNKVFENSIMICFFPEHNFTFYSFWSAQFESHPCNRSNYFL